jgi:CubicO group peptidase (beta-lactamase class C family)
MAWRATPIGRRRETDGGQLVSTFDGSGIDKVLQAAVDNAAVPHVAAIAADRDGVFYEGAAGERVTGGGEPVSTSTHFRIMSMTKMVATTAALQQVERGGLDLAAPVEDYVPEFADLQVLEGFDGDTPRLRAPASRATVKQLVTHTSGLSYWFWNPDIARYESVTGLPNVVPGEMAAFGAPLVADPGTRFEYGINTDWLGRGRRGHHARRRGQGEHHRPARHGRHDVRPRRGPAGQQDAGAHEG